MTTTMSSRAERSENVSSFRILIFGINYAPELTGIGPYTTELAEHFSASGHQVEVVTGLPHYPEWRRLPTPTAVAANPSVSRFWHFIPRRPGAVGRMLYELTWLINAARGALNSRPDLVIGVVPSLSGGLLALLTARRNNVPFGLIVQDLMGPAAAQSGYRGGSIVAGATGAVEGFMLRRCDRIGVVSEAFRDRLTKSGIPNSRIRSVRNWTRTGEPTESIGQCRRRLGWAPDDFICLHAGNLGRKQGLDNLLDVAPLLTDTRIRIVLAGDGNDRSRLRTLAQARRLPNVSFVALQSPGRYEAMLQAADVLLVSQRPSVGDMSLPSKLTAYFAAGRPIIAAVAPSSATAREVERGGAGIIVPAGDGAALAAAIHTLMNREVAEKYAKRGKEYAERCLTAAAVMRTYDDFALSLRLPGSQPSANGASEDPLHPSQQDRTTSVSHGHGSPPS